MKRSWDRDSKGRTPVNRVPAKLTSTNEKEQKQEQEQDVKRPKYEDKIKNRESELHPLLRDSSPVNVIPKSFNPLKQQKNKLSVVDTSNGGSTTSGGGRSGFVVNPYLTDIGFGYQKPKRSLQLVEHGKYIEKGNEIRAKIREEKKEEEKLLELKSKGLNPDLVLGEQNYKLQQPPPSIEWWDRPLLKDRNYGHLDELNRLNYLDPNDEENPISIYIQHPVPIRAPWEKHLPPLQPLYLTKKELKRLRKNERAIRHKEKQDRIIVGLDPPPPPKVKLKNLMNVLTNEAIKNPTEVEMKVRGEIEMRKLEHERMNEERKLTSEQRHEKIKLQIEKDLSKGIFSIVYKIDRLINPQHFYKVDMNAKQLDLKGMVLRPRGDNNNNNNNRDKFSLIIVEGGNKSIKQYKKLIERRIKWTENVLPKKRITDGNDDMQIDEELEDLSNNKCHILWEGQLKNLHFQKWTVYEVSDEEAIELLGKYKLENYWKQAVSLNE